MIEGDENRHAGLDDYSAPPRCPLSSVESIEKAVRHVSAIRGLPSSNVDGSYLRDVGGSGKPDHDHRVGREAPELRGRNLSAFGGFLVFMIST